MASVSFGKVEKAYGVLIISSAQLKSACLNESVFFEGRRLGAVDWNGVVDEPHGAAFVPTRLHNVQSAAERP